MDWKGNPTTAQADAYQLERSKEARLAMAEAARTIACANGDEVH